MTTQQKINQLQLLEQSVQQSTMQKQQFQSQLIEVESALKEIENTETAYKIIGNIMVLCKKEDLQKDLDKRKEILELRIKTFEKQENDLKDKAKKMQEEVMKELKK